jgi:hypothetical protein
VDIEPDQARELYRQLGDFVRAHPNDETLVNSGKMTIFARLALLASRIAPGDVKDWSDQSRSCSSPPTGATRPSLRL